MINDLPNKKVRNTSRKRPRDHSSRSQSMVPNDGTHNDTSLDDDCKSESETSLIADDESTHNPEETKSRSIIRKKTREEVRFLEEQFARDPVWTSATVQI
jgi:hypothetical protein